MKIVDDLHAFIWRNPSANNCNTYILRGEKNILIDPGHYQLFGPVQMGLLDLNLAPEKIDLVLITHGHPDHLEAVARFRKPTLTALGYEEYLFIQNTAKEYGWDLSRSGIEPDFFLQEGEFRVGDKIFQVFVTPGHSPGSICLYWPENKVLFTGDVVFPQGIGRTDLPGGDGSQLKKSIQRLAGLEVEYLLSGHGEVIRGKKAVEANFRMIEEYWFNYL
jgi:glyoxylase-like metal-dependent hydrolase (beta-lactamase superfamily II)